MEYFFHIMEIDHPLDNTKGNIDLLFLGELLVLLVDLVKQTALLQVLSDQNILLSCDAHPHI